MSTKLYTCGNHMHDTELGTGKKSDTITGQNMPIAQQGRNSLILSMEESSSPSCSTPWEWEGVVRRMGAGSQHCILEMDGFYSFLDYSLRTLSPIFSVIHVSWSALCGPPQRTLYPFFEATRHTIFWASRRILQDFLLAVTLVCSNKAQCLSHTAQLSMVTRSIPFTDS